MVKLILYSEMKEFYILASGNKIYLKSEKLWFILNKIYCSVSLGRTEQQKTTGVFQNVAKNILIFKLSTDFLFGLFQHGLIPSLTCQNHLYQFITIPLL